MGFTGISMINFLIARLGDCLSKDLPGARAQNLMAPSVRPPGLDKFDGTNPLSSGVMILLFPADEGISTVFIKRTQGGAHSGQIALPGGKQEYSDQNLLHTAKRETFEEIGVKADLIRDIGVLTPLYVPHSNFVIQPVIGFVTFYPVFELQKEEVAEVIVVPIRQLFNPVNRKTMSFHHQGTEIIAPYYDTYGHQIWGATAMIISEFEVVFTSCIS